MQKISFAIFPEYRQKHLAERLPRMADMRAKESQVSFCTLLSQTFSKKNLTNRLLILCDIFEITTKAPFGAPAMHGRQVCKGVYDSGLHTFGLESTTAQNIS